MMAGPFVSPPTPSPAFEFSQTSKGRPLSYVGDFKYRIKKYNKSSINWECIDAERRDCKGRMVTDRLHNIKLISGYHTCLIHGSLSSIFIKLIN
jgi:hypothetical protein